MNGIVEMLDKLGNHPKTTGAIGAVNGVFATLVTEFNWITYDAVVARIAASGACLVTLLTIIILLRKLFKK